MSTFVNPLTEYMPQMETFEGGAEMMIGETSSGVFNEGQEMELAAQFLELASDQELENFLGDLIKGAGHALGKFVNSPLGQAIGGVLKAAAKKAIPIAGGALGGLVGGPLGASLGSGLASMAGKALGLELEGLSPEDREFESSKQFIKFAAQTVKTALDAPAHVDPATVARNAAAEAARLLAPGFIDIAETTSTVPQAHARTGLWIRHKGKITLFGI